MADMLLGVDDRDDDDDPGLPGGLPPDGVQIEGTGLDDVLMAGPDGDTLYGFDGNDRLIGGDGDDRIFAGNDDDTLDGRGGNDVLGGGAGADLLIAQAGTDTLFGGTGADLFVLEGGAGFANGGPGADRFEATVGTWEVRGGLGDDVIMVDGAQGSFYGGIGEDRIAGHGVTLAGGIGDDLIVAYGSPDGQATTIIDAGVGDDMIFVDVAGTQVTTGEGADEVCLTTSSTVTDFDTTQDRLTIEIDDQGGTLRASNVTTNLEARTIGGVPSTQINVTVRDLSGSETVLQIAIIGVTPDSLPDTAFLIDLVPLSSAESAMRDSFVIAS